MIGDLPALDATAALAALRDGALTSETLVRACLERIAARDEAVRAWAHLDPEAALAQARAADAAPLAGRGPLHGLPIGVKDVIQTRDMPTRYNSPLYAEPPPTPDAACVSLLRAAGAVILGKTAAIEFAAIGRPPETRNPHDPTRTPGGSSGGSAAAVADGQAPLALGTQTGGSMIRPASFCGAWAFKPTWGLISNEGCKRFAPTLDTLGWFARSARDLSLLLGVLAPDPAAKPAPPRTPRLALCRTPMWERAEPATRDAFTEAGTRLRQAGAEVVDFGLSSAFDRVASDQLAIMLAEGRVSFQPERLGLEGRMREMADGIDIVSDAALRDAYAAADFARVAFDRLAAQFDAVLAPSTPGEAPLGLASTGDLVFNGLWTLLHTPCVNAPLWRGPAGLPVGLTLTGVRGSDRRVLAAAAWLADAAALSPGSS